MNRELVWQVLVAGVLVLFGGIVLSSLMLTYASTFTSEISGYYLEMLSVTGAVNAVCAILMDFRAYDTLGEVLIIFVTISGVVCLMGRKR